MFVIAYKHPRGFYRDALPSAGEILPTAPTIATARKWRSFPEAQMHAESVGLDPNGYSLVRCDPELIEKLQQEEHERFMILRAAERIAVVEDAMDRERARREIEGATPAGHEMLAGLVEHVERGGTVEGWEERQKVEAEELVVWRRVSAGRETAEFRGFFADAREIQGRGYVAVTHPATDQAVYSTYQAAVRLPSLAAAKAEGERVMREHISKKGGV